MSEFLQTLWTNATGSTEALALLGLGGGVLVLFFGLASLGRTPAEVRRLQAGLPNQRRRSHVDIVREDNFDLGGLLRAFVPSSKSERTRIGRRMRKAGILRKNGVYFYYLVRALLAIGLPAIFLGLALAPTAVVAYIPPVLRLGGVPLATLFQMSVALAVAGFYLPALWLHLRIVNRRKRIRYSLPNTLDLLQITIEAGLGFDAAMMRVSRELAHAAPDLSQEFMMMQLEIQAGKDRSAAFLEMADRTDIDEARAFANVMIQSAQYGSSVSKALKTFAEAIRTDRELKAQEKANRLPVQMSAVMALFMMPVLLMICLAPMVIRWVRMF